MIIPWPLLIISHGSSSEDVAAAVAVIPGLVANWVYVAGGMIMFSNSSIDSIRVVKTPPPSPSHHRCRYILLLVTNTSCCCAVCCDSNLFKFSPAPVSALTSDTDGRIHHPASTVTTVSHVWLRANWLDLPNFQILPNSIRNNDRGITINTCHLAPLTPSLYCTAAISMSISLFKSTIDTTLGHQGLFYSHATRPPS